MQRLTHIVNKHIYIYIFRKYIEYIRKYIMNYFKWPIFNERKNERKK